MIEKRIRKYMVMIIACISSALFTIFSYAAVTSVSKFTVPNNVSKSGTLFFYYTDTQGNSSFTTGSIGTDGSFNIKKPSDFASGYICTIEFDPFLGTGSQSNNVFYGITLYNTSFVVVGTPTIWLNQNSIDSYYSFNSYSSYSSQTKNTLNNYYIQFRFPVYHQQGDGGSYLTSADFPLTGSMYRYLGSYNYASPSSSGSGSPSGSGASGSDSNSQNIQATYNSVTTLISDTNNGFVELSSQLNNMEGSLSSSLEWMAYNLSTLTNGLATGSTWEDSEGNTFEYPTYNQISFRLANEHVQFDTTQKCGTFLGILSRKFDELFEFFKFQFEIFFQWFYPLKDSNPQYWLVYDTDDDSGKWVNPATVTYYITWYLGQLYSQNYDDEEGALTSLTQSVNNFATQAQNFETAENGVINSVKSYINNFNPDLSQIGGFRAIGWCANYLQRIYVALGAYGIVITIGLLLGVCMQFIGYFKYK